MIPISGAIVGPEPLTDEWFSKRLEVIGGSDASAACGLSEYSTPRKLYEIKKGNIPSFEGNEHTRRGRRYEPLIAEDWQEQTGRKLAMYPCPMFIHPQHDFIAATPDGIVSDTEGLEIKSTTWRSLSRYGEQGTDHVPVDYVVQAQQQMLVMGWSVVYFAIKVELNEAPLSYVVNRNDHLINLMVSAEQEFIERLRNSDPPELNWTHSSTPELIKELHQTVCDTRIELSAEAVAHWMRYEELGKTMTAMKDERDLCKAHVLAEIGDHGAGLLGDGFMVRRKRVDKAEYVVKPQSYVDTRKVKADAGQIVDRETFLPYDVLVLEQRWLIAQQLLDAAGATLHGESEATRSRYWKLPTGAIVRVSDHAPNLATKEWMDRDGVLSVRIDDPDLNLEIAVGAAVSIAALMHKE